MQSTSSCVNRKNTVVTRKRKKEYSWIVHAPNKKETIMSEELEEVNQQYVEEYLPAIVLVIIVLSVGVSGNIFAVIFYGWKAQKSVSQFLIVSLSVNDALTNLVLVDDVVDFYNTVKYRSVGACKVFWVLKHWLIGNSLLFMVAIAVERFRRVCYPFSRQLTLHAAQHLIIWTAIFSFLISARYFVTADVVRNNLTAEDNSTQGYYCSRSYVPELQAIENVFHWVDICTHVIIICLLIVFYSLIVRKIIHSNRRLQSHEKLSIISYKRKRSHTDGLEESNTDVVEIHFDTNQDNTSSSSNIKEFPELKDEGKETDQSVDVVYCDNNHPAAKTNGNHTMRKRISKVFRQMKSENSLSVSSGIEMRITVMVAVITIASVTCFVPYYISMLVVTADMSGRGLILSVGEVIWRRSFMLNSAINPFIMAIFNASFRQFLASIFCCKCKEEYIH